jgi:hypothetical protein
MSARLHFLNGKGFRGSGGTSDQGEVRHSVNRPLFAFGILFLIVGVASGYLMYTQPEGLNPAWPMGMALLAPAVFALGGLHLIAAGLGRPRLSNAMLGAIALCLWVIANWAAFFTAHFQCVATVSFLGAKLVEWHPSELECRNSLRTLMAVVDALLVVAAGVFAWQRNRAPRKEPGSLPKDSHQTERRPRR